MAADTRSQTVSKGVADNQTIQQQRPIHLDTEGHKLLAAGFEPKERSGRIIWQRPDTGFWVSQEMALHLSESNRREEGQRA